MAARSLSWPMRAIRSLIPVLARWQLTDVADRATADAVCQLEDLGDGQDRAFVRMLVASAAPSAWSRAAGVRPLRADHAADRQAPGDRPRTGPPAAGRAGH